jgi:nitroreductase
VTERIMLAAQALGLGAGVVWFSEPPAMAEARRLLNIPEGHALISAVAIGHPAPADPTAPKRDQPRKPLSEIVHWETFGKR